MKIKYIRHKDIDRTKWDQCIGHSSNARIYALSWYLDITSPGWDALVYGDYEFIMPLTWRKKYGLKYLIQPYYSQQLGVFGKNPDTNRVRDFLNAIPLQFLYVRINGNDHNESGQGLSAHRINNNFVLDLKKDYPDLEIDFSKNNRRNIRLAKRQLSSARAIDQETFTDFFSKFLSKRFSHLPKRHFEILKLLIDALKKHQMAEILGAYTQDGRLCSTACFLSSFDRKILIASATDEAGRKTKAHFFLINHFIEAHAGMNLLLDFEGSNIAYFNAGFGGICVPYPTFRFNNIRHKLHV